MSDRTLKPWQQGVVEESTALKERISKLRAFVDSEEHGRIQESERARLGRQLSVMFEYAIILDERIAEF